MKRSIYRLLFFCLLLLSFSNVKATDERYAAPALHGNQLAPDSTSMVMDTVYFNPGLKPLQTTYFVRNLITFQIDEAYRNTIPDEFSVQIKFVVHYVRDDNGTPVPEVSDEKTLTVEYSKFTTYDGKMVYVDKDWYKAEVEITGITALNGDLNDFREALLLTNEILVSREYNFTCTDNSIKDIFANTATVNTKGELNVYWQPERAADEYDLEWTYIDDLALPEYQTGSGYNIKKIFTNNATRVSISRESYNIPLLYEASGYLFYRVRAVQVKPGGQRVESVWSSDYALGLGSYSFTGLDSSLNWQASTSFAEEGKRKSVVQYFDGSLKSRQTVTKDNTTDTTVIAETFYDHQGRPVIQVMPTPSLSSIIKYTPGFNTLNGAEYRKDEYDGVLQDTCYCQVGAPAMDVSSGASNYYSPSNPLGSNGFHKYIPDAKGFVFAETQYTPDNTGRISAQGGVGETFRIGNKHTTNYTYGAADQEELDALFGTEVGNNSHYFKNTVRDANGQVSISYVDMHGRTIATALAGKPPVLVDTLESNRSNLVVKKLLDSNSNVIKGTEIESSKGLQVTKAGLHRFVYSLLPDSISMATCDNATICYDCIYDLKITITEDCNDSSKAGQEPIVITRTNYKLDVNCDPINNFPAVDTTVYLYQGSYMVTKTLTVNKKAMDYYLNDVFLVRNTCRTLEQTIQEQQTLMASKLSCDPVEETTSEETIKQQMLADVTPPYGQYANLNKLDNYSVFWPNPIPHPNWQIVSGIYYDNDGVPENPDPKTLTSDDFVAAFKDSWAETLLRLHPEYEKYIRYINLAQSNAWDKQFGSTETFQEAVSKGYLNPGNFSIHPTGAIFNNNATYADPLFTTYVDIGRVDVSYKNMMQDSLLYRARDNSGNDISIWSLATMLTRCNSTDASCFLMYTPLDNAFTISADCSGDLDMAWKYFREMYLQKKRDIMASILRDYTVGFNLSDVARNHHLNFYDPELVAVNNLPGTVQAGMDSLNLYISQNCEAYAQQWMADLGGCYDSADLSIIIPQLVQVCKEGGDENHLMGASTVKPGSTNTYKSFEEVLKAYDASRYNSACNVYLISGPAPYDQQPVYTNKPVFQKPDECECATIGNLYDKYKAVGQDTSFAAYVYRITGTKMSQNDLDVLRMACNGQINCSYLSAPVYLPPALQCGVKDACVDCDRFDGLYKQYMYQFPDAKPSIDSDDSLQNERNKLFERFMNTQLGFGKTTAEYLAFRQQCGFTDTQCDTLKDVLKAYNRMRLADSSHFERNKIVPNEQFNYTVSDIYKNGYAHIPDQYVNTVNFGSHYTKYDTICTGNVFTAVTRIKKPARDSSMTNFNFQLHFNDDYVYDNIGPIFYLLGKNPNAADTAAMLANSGMIGYGREGNYTPPANPFISDYSDWVEIKVTHGSDNIFRVYYNGIFVSQRYVAMPVTRLIGFAAIFEGKANNGYVDYFKVYDQNNNLQYVEEFEDARQSPSNDPAAFRCTDSCQAKFTRFYNQYTNSAKTYAQIQQAYGNCGQTLDGCSYGNNADSLMSWYNTYKRYGRTPNFDASGADTTNWKIDFGGWNYTAGVPLGEMIKNGVMALPAYYADTLKKGVIDLDYINDTLCIDTAGFTWETRLKLPDSVITPNGYGASWWLWLYTEKPDPGNMLMAISNINNKGVAICTHQSQSNQDCADVNVPGVHMNDWRVVKFVFRGRDFKYYIDDSLQAQRTLDAPMAKLYGFSLDEYSRKGQIDYIRIYKPDSTMIFDEEFNDPYNLATHDDESLCSTCGEGFAAYFNQRNGSELSIAAVDSIYYATLNFHISDCYPPSLKLCGKTEPVFTTAPWEQRTPCADSTLFGTSTGVLIHEAYSDSLLNSFTDRYLAKCLSARYHENFTLYQEISEFHYTLYYYDQAGNLEKTIPPAGVDVSKLGWARAWSDSVTIARRNKQQLTPNHTLPTQYRYNTLNQVVAQQSPDGGMSEFWYDRLGRLVISQNARQRAAATAPPLGGDGGGLYSYTRYDSLGRITEVGQVSNTAANGAMTEVVSRNEPILNNWLDALQNRRGQITNTVYDLPYPGFTGVGDPRQIITQRNLRNRVSYTTLTDTGTSNAYNQGTFYTYDILGNVDYLLQDYGSSSFAATANVMNKNDNRWKKTGYQYDLISGKVNMVMYQQGWSDGLYHRYSYDAENRLTMAETSRDSLVWEKDARYEYYRHGPLARVTLGDQQVQGMDYAYTLQGWLKGINSTGGTDSFDMGGDGHNGSLAQYTARDAFGLTLNYFGNDYTAINGQPFPGYSAFLPADAYRPLYNGNISSSSVYQKKFDYSNSPGGPLIFYNYKYDQLNRLTAQDTYNGFLADQNKWDNMNAMGERAKERVAYDANGNIQKYLRKSMQGGIMDSLNYYYYNATNQLRFITDSVGANDYDGGPDHLIVDIDGQADSNYVYDFIGNLIQDKAENITDIKWNVYGKIQEISRTATASVPTTNIKYTYDALGNRISQVVTSGGTKYYTWYVRDAQGNMLSTYTAEGNAADLASLQLNQEEKFLYGSSRLGLISVKETVDGGPDYMQSYYDGRTFSLGRGHKQYELTNHLGNVLATISDRKFGVPSAGSSLIDHFEPDIVTAQDYYPFGMMSREALPNSGVAYKFGFNGKLNDNDVKGGFGLQQDYGMRIYDPRVGRFLSVDPLTKDYPGYSPYPFAMNRPIDGVDLDGGEWQPLINLAADKAKKAGYPTLSGILRGLGGLDIQSQTQQLTDNTMTGNFRGVAKQLYGYSLKAQIDNLEATTKRAINDHDDEAYGELYTFIGVGALGDVEMGEPPTIEGFKFSEHPVANTNKLAIEAHGNFEAGEGNAANATTNKVNTSGKGTGGKESLPISSKNPKLRYELKNTDLDWRGQNKSLKDALDEAFSRTGTEKGDFVVTKWGKNQYGKSIPVEWRAKNGAEVNIDLPHQEKKGIQPGPDAPHVGWQTPGKRAGGGAERGHIILDEVPTGRGNVKE